jgi:hypothetical protein
MARARPRKRSDDTTPDGRFITDRDAVVEGDESSVFGVSVKIELSSRSAHVNLKCGRGRAGELKSGIGKLTAFPIME